MYIICIIYVYCMYIVRILYVYYMYIICIIYVFYMYIIFILYVYHMYIICILYVYYMYTVLVVVVVAAHSSSCSPGTHLHRQIDRQAPAKYDQVTSPMGIFSPSKNVVHLHQILRGQSEHLHLGTSLRECRRKTSGCSFSCEVSIKPGL